MDGVVDCFVYWDGEFVYVGDDIELGVGVFLLVEYVE